MNNETILTCAVTGAGDTLDKHPDVSLSGTTLKHRIRSALYGLKQAGKVELISKATYSVTKKFL